MDFSGKVTVVTGGALGIGGGISRKFAEKGSKIVIADIDLESANKNSEKIISMGGECEIIKTDISKSEDIKKMVEFIRESEKAKGTQQKKMTRGETLQREVLGKSVICASDIQVDEIFSEKNIEVKSPARGLSPQYFYELLGKKSNRVIKRGEYLQLEDLS